MIMTEGLFDLQVNGFAGVDFNDADLSADAFESALAAMAATGVVQCLPTLITATEAELHARFAALDAAVAQAPRGAAMVPGYHLEGPFLNPSKRGAHPQEHLLPLTLDHVQRVLGNYSHLVKIMTLAPELDPTGSVISHLTKLGMIVSLGHSQATAAQAEQAFNQGAKMVTHAFNAMPSLHHREPGLLGAAFIHPGVQLGLIADGQHVSPLMVKLLLRMSGRETTDFPLFLVSDALSPLGLPDGVYPWDEREIEVKQGTARLADGTLAGTTLPLLTGVQNLVQWNCCGVEDAIALATLAPRQALGLSSLIGESAFQLLRWRVDSSAAIQTLSWQRLFSCHPAICQ